ncbi:trifunctional serine/threonine-protein kinase/ATP-binding protein/sensor histidine kinase [Fulvivirga ulvae]|uniref:ATP-binding sensor histidine kinase n=1 Tax=Fulvivirga ulvae TaxID=2904245 RepID=UPI001F20A189|nr:ATP-binding sensor histidine kinase [Fulvivirga ulvae]UII31425.1 trifunctional serine/threonine-protein kinase/ATP-binding protein/sensor histidine kinase [Fulvivirga ulvae]
MEHVLNKSKKIAEGGSSLIYLNEQSEFGEPVIIKIYKKDNNSYAAENQLINEYDFLSQINIDGVRKPVKKIEVNHRPALVLEYFEGKTLKDFIAKQPPNLLEFLEIGIKICETIGYIHEHDVIHKDINGHNILINDDHEIKIIDFGIATKFRQQTALHTNIEHLEGTISHISPEQTGRVNRVIDKRSDLYSLGVLFYEWLTGKLPFADDDPMKLVHSHLAMVPQAVHERDPSIPQVLSNMVSKLLAKNADDRYQSARGLKDDLNLCLEQLRDNGSISTFKIGENDHSDTPRIIQKVYGRDKEIMFLQSVFERVCQGNSETVLISGDAGTGKSTLTFELRNNVIERGGNFIFGKFNQLHHEKPYHALTQAFKVFADNILIQSEQQLKAWKQKIMAAVSDEGRLLTDVIPELELIIGSQPEIADLDPEETKNRFNYIFRQFIDAIASVEHPLVWIIDDLQWADPASVALLKTITSDSAISHVLIIGTYRTNELGDHLLPDSNARHLSIEGLTVHQLSELIADALGCKHRDVVELAEATFSKTQGNAFFAHQFLQTIYDEKLLWFDRTAQNWQWDLKRINSLQVTDNVIVLLTKRIKNLDQDCRSVLEFAACYNEQFDLTLLAHLHGKSPTEIRRTLYPAIRQGLIQELTISSQRKGMSVSKPETQYTFVHDRIVQSIYSSISEPDRKKIHWKTGKYLLDKNTRDHSERLIFDITYHLNSGVDAYTGKNDIYELTRLNFEAGNLAKASAAYPNALEYYGAALRYSEENIWTRYYDLALAVHTGAAEASFLAGQFSATDAHIEKVISNATSTLDQIKAIKIRIEVYIAQNQALRAIELALDTLGKLGEHLPSKPSKALIAKELIKTSLQVNRIGIRRLEQLPAMADPHKKAAMNIMASIGSAISRTTPELLPLMIFKMIRISIKYGNSIESIPNYAGYSIILSGVLGNLKDGYKFGELAMKLLQKFKAEKVKAKTHLVHHCFVHHWRNHLNTTLDPLLETYHYGMESGDHEFAASALMVRSFHGYFSGRNLLRLNEEMSAQSKKIQHLNQELLFYQNEIFRQAALNLTGKSKNPTVLSGEAFDSNSVLTEDFKKNNPSALFHALYHSMVLSYMFKDYEKAREYAEELESKLELVVGTIILPLYHFNRTLVLFANLPSLKGVGKSKANRKIKDSIRKMKKWSKYAPMNFEHKYYLLLAEKFRTSGRYDKARLFYDKAISSASANNYLNDEALCYELAGSFYASEPDKYPYEIYLRKAYENYLNWGATAKAEEISRHYPIVDINLLGGKSKHSTSLSSNSTSNYSTLELSTILKASTAIASEIKLVKVLDKLLRIVIENAGAERGFLLQKKDADLFVSARGTASDEKIIIFDDIKAEEFDDLPQSIIQYSARIRETVIIDDINVDNRFASDPYIQKAELKSILCSPILVQNELIGIIYLENNLVAGAFTPKRLDMLKLLSGQIAVSLDNAMLYNNLEQLVIERTQEIEAQQEILKDYNHELIALNEEKNHLIKIVAHDLRSPLNQIKGMVNLIKLTTRDKSEEQSQYVNKVLESTERLGEMISRILDVNAIEAKEIDLKNEKVNLRGLLGELKNNFQLSADEKNIELSIEPGPDVFINVDNNYTIQVFENLLSNALKFSPSDTRVDICIIEKEKSACVTVSDQGPGINEKDMKKLFMPYQKLTAKPTAGEESTGLGLSIVKKYVEAMKGSIRCESTEGKGATFYVEFKKWL